MSLIVYPSNIDTIKLVVDTKTWKVESYRGVSDSPSKALPTYLRFNDTGFYRLKGKTVDKSILYEGRRDKTRGNSWVIQEASTCKINGKSFKKYNEDARGDK